MARLFLFVMARSKATKQFRLRHSGAMQKHRTRNLEIPRCAIAHLRSGANAPSRNDSFPDCFGEPVIGRAFARPVGSSGLLSRPRAIPHYPISEIQKFRLPTDPNQFTDSRRPAPQRGVRTSRTRGGMRWTRQRARRTRPAGVRPSRVVLAPQCRRQVCDKKRRRRCQTSVVTGESAK
jgi:hypothetical protein